MDMCTLTTTTNTLLIITLMFGSLLLVTEGRPINRQEHGSGDLIAGEAFLSILMGPRMAQREIPIPTTTVTTSTEEEIITTTVQFRETTTTERTLTETPNDLLTNQVNVDFNSNESSDSLSDDGMIISVRVSSSVGRKVDEKIEDNEDSVVSTTAAAVPIEEHPSIIAEANKSDFSVDEGEPITRNSNFESAYDAVNKPYQETVIYHNREPNRARSVSYSTVIQAIPNLAKWGNVTGDEAKSSPSSAAESKDYYVTSKYNPPDYNESLEKRYESSSRRYYEPTERNWNYPQKYIAPKQYYPQPEQNYEVDEAVSVESNGRAHGVQRSEEAKKKDDNQKVGYVVEGRNYRKYRVEERTSDGFIVGEYGVVSHDDGSLRGVRYTADGTINPRLIYDALMKFLAL